MVVMNLHLPEEYMAELSKFGEVKWNEVARQAIEKEIHKMEIAEQLFKQEEAQASCTHIDLERECKFEGHVMNYNNNIR
ncbi:MAG: hypothetical protein WC755_06470 [Candidatus Woesearchaeota archaeon]